MKYGFAYFKVAEVVKETHYLSKNMWKLFDTVEGDCIYEDEYATPEIEQNYADLVECIDYHLDVTCVKLEEVVERLNRLYNSVENLLYIDKLNTCILLLHMSVLLRIIQMQQLCIRMHRICMKK